MTTNQINFYWRLWKAACDKQHWTTKHGLNSHQITDLRHHQHHAALCLATSHQPLATCPNSHSMKDLSNHQFDLIVAHFQLLANQTDLSAALRLADPDTGDRKRLLYRIEHLAPEAYRNQIAQDKFHTTNLDDLDVSQLTQLRNTLVARAQRKKNQSPTDQSDPTNPSEPELVGCNVTLPPSAEDTNEPF